MELAIDPTRQRSVRWHPKITPYRLLVFLTTAVLGTVKACLTYRGRVMASTTLEWVAGVVISLMFNILGDYESKAEYRKYLGWFYQYDCMDLLWQALHILLDVQRPSYKSDEITLHWSRFSASRYQILVSLTVTTFGLAKAVFTYLGWNTAATTFDWILAVVVTSILYYIGLYELNSINFGRSFFHDDYLPLLRKHGMAGIVHGSFLLAGVVWIIFWSLTLVKFLKTPWYPQGDTGFIPSIRISGFILMVYFQIFMFSPGFRMIRFSWESMKRDYRHKGSLIPFSAKRRISSVYKAGLTFLGLTGDALYPSLDESSHHRFLILGVIRIFVRLIIHLVLAVPCICAAFLFMVGAVLSGETMEHGKIMSSMFSFLLACSSAGLSLGLIYCLFLTSLSVVNSISNPAISAIPILQSWIDTNRF